MMKPVDIYDTRQRRVRQLVQDEFGGSQAAFASRIDRAANYVSRMLSPGEHRKRISEKLAREIEALLGKPAGYLDEGATVVKTPAATLYGLPVTRRAVEVAHEWEKLPEPMRSTIQTLIEVLVAQEKRSGKKKLAHRDPVITVRPS